MTKTKPSITNASEMEDAILRLHDATNAHFNPAADYGGFNSVDLGELSEALCDYWDSKGLLVLNAGERLIDVFDQYAPSSSISQEVLKPLDESFLKACGFDTFSEPPSFGWGGGDQYTWLTDFGVETLEDWVKEQIALAVGELPTHEVENFFANSAFESWQEMPWPERETLMVNDVLENWSQELIEKLLKKGTQ